MGSIKDIIDLINQLRDSVKDRKAVSELLQIQSYVDELHSDCLLAKERALDYKTETSQLKEDLIEEKRKKRELKDSYEEKLKDVKLIHQAEMAGTNDSHEMYLEKIDKNHSKEIDILKEKIVELENQLKIKKETDNL